MTKIAVTTVPSEHEKELAASLVYDTHWTEEAYLAVSDLNRILELSEGRLVIHDMPVPQHQRIVRNLSRQLEDWATEHQAGEVLFAPMPVRLWPGKFREPDVMFYLAEHADRVGERFGEATDLVAEVLSTSTATIDQEEKFSEYAQAGIPEYWIIDPDERTVEVFVLRDDQYVLHGRFQPGQSIRSALLPDFEVDVDTIFGV